MAEYDTFPEFVMGLDGDAEVRISGESVDGTDLGGVDGTDLDGDLPDDAVVVVTMPAETVEYAGDTVLYQVEHAFPVPALSGPERRERDLWDLADEYAALVEAHGEAALDLIDTDPDSTVVAVRGKQLYRGGSAASVRPLPDDARRDVLDTLDDGARPDA